MQSFAYVISSLQPSQLCLLCLVYNEFARVPISFFLVYYLMFTMYSNREQCCHFHFVRSLVSLVYNEFEQGPNSFIELLFYPVG